MSSKRLSKKIIEKLYMRGQLNEKNKWVNVVLTCVCANEMFMSGDSIVIRKHQSWDVEDENQVESVVVRKCINN
jgi:hypothetical protein